MNKILILGAGRSSATLIRYLEKSVIKNNGHLTIGDINFESLSSQYSIQNHLNIIKIDIHDPEFLSKTIQNADVVISMLPAQFHFIAAEICAHQGKHFLSASYVTPNIKNLNHSFQKNNKLCLMEMGLDPGIDHMSAMKVIHQINDKGYNLTSFETYTGGLVDDETQEKNPWNYKFTWNPRNVILAGQGYVKFIQEGRYKYIPYHQLFRRTEVIEIPNIGVFEGYPNRDSLRYQEVYKLDNIATLFRGTLRKPGFCKSWNSFVQLGATDDTYKLENVNKLTHRQFINTFLPYNPRDTVELKLAYYLNIGLESQEMYNLKWLDVFKNIPVGLTEGTPAQILEHILLKKWKLGKNEKDMIVMLHKFQYQTPNTTKKIQTSVVVKGDNPVETAMSKTVGLPLAIAVELILQNKITLTGVHIPVMPQIYNPVLKKLSEKGLTFNENEID